MDEEMDELVDEELEEISSPCVSLSESVLLNTARSVIMQDWQSLVEILSTEMKLPPKIGVTCGLLLEQTISQMWTALWRISKAAPRKMLDGVRRRPWEITDPVPLEVSKDTYCLLEWLVTSRFNVSSQIAPPELAKKQTLGDQVFMLLLISSIKDRQLQLKFLSHQTFNRQPLVRLMYSDLIGLVGWVPAEEPKPKTKKPPQNDFAPLTTGVGSVIVTCLSSELAKRWTSIDIAKRSMTNPEELIAIGIAQQATLDSFMAACNDAKRRDLCRWIIDAARPLLDRDIKPVPTYLDKDKTLSLRAQSRIACGSLLRAIVDMGKWDQEHRAIHYVEDGYRQAQVVLEQFEPIGSAGVNKATAWLLDMASLPTGD